MDAKFDDDSLIAGRYCGTSAEQWYRLRVADCQGARFQNKFGKDRRGAFRRNTQDFFIEIDKTIQVVGNNAYRSKIHEIPTFL